jgi:hypothetical protein
MRAMPFTVSLLLVLSFPMSGYAQSDRNNPSASTGNSGKPGAVMQGGPASPSRTTMKPGVAGAASEKATGAHTAMPLSEGECATLGGTVNATSVCMSGKACTTTGEDKQAHAVCISKK